VNRPAPAAAHSPAGSRDAVLELVAPNVLDEDLHGLEPHLIALGLEPRGAFLREVVRRRLPVEGAGLVAGRLPFVRAALQRRSVAVPAPLDYLGASPSSLGRGVWPSTLGAVAASLEHRGEPVFVKPRGTAKRFTGRVVTEVGDLRSLPVRSASTPVWCSEVVEIVSEHRVFMIHGRVVGTCHYDGAAAVPPEDGAVDAICADVMTSVPAGCALDVAVLTDGTVVLIEGNDGYSLGRYGLDGETYAALLLARWAELVAASG
jgi:hypothetical protein